MVGSKLQSSCPAKREGRAKRRESRIPLNFNAPKTGMLPEFFFFMRTVNFWLLTECSELGF